jgi:peptidoglycan hydrolase CwlO-like protein
MKKTLTFLFLLFIALWHAPVLAVEIAPRISDREIIESLAELKAGQKALEQRFDDMNNSVNKRLDDINKRFDDINKRFDDLQESTNNRFDDVNKRLDDINKRFGDLQESTNNRFDDINGRFDILQWMFGLFITAALSLMGIMGRILWNQQKKLTQIETSLEAQKEELSFLKSLIEKLQSLIEKLLPPSGVL